MSQTKLQKTFKKLQHQAQAILSDDNTLSRIEKDYLKQLTIQFYDALVESSEQRNSEVNLKDLQSTISRSQAAPVVETKAKVQQESAPAVTPEPQIVVKETKAVQAPEPKKEEVQREVQATPAAEQRIEIEAVVEVEDSAFMELFAQADSGDLSDRLSQRPIENISKAMGVNERIFMTNELFNGDSDAFQKHIQALNKVADFNSAKEYIIKEMIPQYNWNNESKTNQAKDFIKLVRRRHPEGV